MSKAYEIIPVVNSSDYAYVVVLCSDKSLHNYLEEVARELRFNMQRGKILIDEIMHVGNTDKRFVEFEYINGELLHGQFVHIGKDSIYRKVTCDFLKDNPIMEGSIITSIQYRMINSGIII